MDYIPSIQSQPLFPDGLLGMTPILYPLTSCMKATYTAQTHAPLLRIADSGL